jgi:heme exporter protein B
MTASKLPGLLQGLVAVVRRDVYLAWRRPGDVLNPLFFFAIVSTLFPLAVGPDAEQLSLNSLFLNDYEDGTLEQLLLSPQPLPLLALAKSIAHWLVSGLPLVLVSPLVAMSFQMPLRATTVMMLTLTLGTISLSLLGSIGAALTVGLNRSNALLSLLILPLAMPVLIFGARTVSLAAAGDAASAGVYFLAAYCMLALTLAPFATAAALKISNE